MPGCLVPALVMAVEPSVLRERYTLHSSYTQVMVRESELAATRLKQVLLIAFFTYLRLPHG